MSNLYIKVDFYFEEINGITTKITTEVPNNLQEILSFVERVLFEYNDYLFARFFFAKSYYQVQNKNLKIK